MTPKFLGLCCPCPFPGLGFLTAKALHHQKQSPDHTQHSGCVCCCVLWAGVEWVVGSSLAGFCKLYMFILAGRLGGLAPALAGGFFTTSTTGKALHYGSCGSDGKEDGKDPVQPNKHLKSCTCYLFKHCYCTSVAKLEKNLPGMRETWIWTLGSAGKIPVLLGGGKSQYSWGENPPLLYSCLENPHGQRSLAGYSPWGTVHAVAKSQMHLSTAQSKCQVDMDKWAASTNSKILHHESSQFLLSF